MERRRGGGRGRASERCSLWKQRKMHRTASKSIARQMCDAPERRTGHGERRDAEEGLGELALEAARRNGDGPTARELDFARELARAELSLLEHALHVVEVASHQRVALRRRTDAKRRMLAKCGEVGFISLYKTAQKILTLDAAAHIKRSVACSAMMDTQVSGAEGLEMSVRMILRGFERMRGSRDYEKVSFRCSVCFLSIQTSNGPHRNAPHECAAGEKTSSMFAMKKPRPYSLVTRRAEI